MLSLSDRHLSQVLIKFLLRAIAISSYAPVSGAPTRPSEDDARCLHRALRSIFERAEDFGGGLFALAASVVTDMIHHDPLVYRSLDEAGLPQAVLNAILVSAGAKTQHALRFLSMSCGCGCG